MYRNIEARSWNHSCSGKAISVNILWVSVRSVRCPACNAHLPIVICGLSGSTVFFFIVCWTARFFEKKLPNKNCVFWFYLQLYSETFFILRRNDRDVIKNTYRSSCKVPVILARFLWNLNFLNRFKNSNVKFHENPSSGSRVVPWGRTDRQTWQS